MYHRITRVKGHIYLQLVSKKKTDDRKTETWKVRQVVVLHLGGYDWIINAFQVLQNEYFALRRGREFKYFNEHEGHCWNGMMQYEEWLHQDDHHRYIRSDALQKEEDMVASWPQGVELPDGDCDYVH